MQPLPTRMAPPRHRYRAQKMPRLQESLLEQAKAKSSRQNRECRGLILAVKIPRGARSTGHEGGEPL